MEIKLNRAEQKLAHYLANARHANARSKGVPNNRIGGQSDVETDLEGIGAEIAFCKMMNVYPDTETDLEADELPIEDATTRWGCRIDVKSTKYSNGHLLAVRGKGVKKDTPDGYCLLIGTFPTYKNAGYMASTELLKDSRINVDFKGSYAAGQEELGNVEQ